MRSGSRYLKYSSFVSIDENVGQVVVQNELQKLVCGGGMWPTVFGIVGQEQSARLRRALESLIMIGIASGAILDPVDVIVVMHHFMQQRCTYTFNRSCKRPCPNVDFMGAPVLGDPSIIPQTEMSVGFWSALNGDGRSWKFTFKEPGIEQIKDFVQVSGNTIVTG